MRSPAGSRCSRRATSTSPPSPARILAAIYPADRQYTARYLRAALGAKEPPLTPYLKKAAEGAGANTITIALDLEDVVDRTILRMSLPSSPAVTNVKTVDVNLLATLLSTVKGMTVAIKVTDTISASVTVEFGNDPTLFRRTLPELFRELIEGQGIAIHGFETWQPAFTATTMTLTGPLTTADLKRVISLFAFPSPSGEGDPGAKGNEPSAAMTKRYITAVENILADVRSMRDSKNYDKTATWHDKAAAQIEQLNERGVDPLAVDAAFEAGKRLAGDRVEPAWRSHRHERSGESAVLFVPALDRRCARRLVGLAALRLRSDSGGDEHPRDPGEDGQGGRRRPEAATGSMVADRPNAGRFPAQIVGEV